MNQSTQTREKWENYCLTERQHSVLTGLMLGDGHLHREKPTHNPVLRLDRAAGDRRYLEDNRSVFKEFCSNQIVPYIATAPDGKQYEMCSFATRSCPYFASYYNEWYDDIGFKRVPRNLILNPEIIAIWFADDGHIKTRKSEYRFYLRLCTEGFLPEDVEFLADTLTTRYGEKFNLLHLGSAKDGHEKLRIVACDYAARKMLQEIDTVFPESMERKAIKWRRPTARFYQDVPPSTNPNLINRLHPSLKEEITLKILREQGAMAVIDLVPLLNHAFASAGLEIMTEQYGPKFVQGLYKRGVLQRKPIAHPFSIGGKQRCFAYFV
jgi:LAGLIDADG DNA endonuclease family protein